jgi:hypothetical protein
MLANNNGGLFGGNSGLGGGILGFLLGLFFGNGWGGNGFFGGNGWGGGNGAGFLSNQLNNDSGRELLMNAINSNGEASRAAISALAASLGQDFNLVNSAVQTLQSGLSSLALQQAVSVPQIINSIQSGDAALQSKLCECCCENRLLTTEQGYQAQIRTLEQTNALGSQADRNTRSITDAIAAQSIMINDKFCDLEKRELQGTITRQGDIISQLRGQLDNAAQTSAIAAMIAPIAKEVDDIKCKMPQTVPVTWPNLAAVNTTPYVSGGYYQGGFNGFYGGGVPGFNSGFNF